MKDIIEQLNALRNQKLSKEERVSLYARINSSIKTPTHTPSPFLQTSTFRMVKRHASLFSRFALVASIIIVIGGGSATFASATALPGDTFYPMKISSEKFALSIIQDPEKKLNLQTQHIENRLIEAKTLLEKNEVSKEAEAILSENLEANVKDMTETIQTLQKEGEVEAIIKNTNELAPILKSHKKVLVEVKEKAKEDAITKEAKKTETDSSLTEIAIQDEPTSADTAPDETLPVIESTPSQIEEVTTLELEETTSASDEAMISSEITEKEILPTTEETTSEIASSLTDSLIETIEETIIVVEKAESDALLQVSEAISSGDTVDDSIVKEAVDSITEKAETQINEIKNTVISIEEVATDSATTTSQSTSINDDILTVEDAEAYLALSQKAYSEKRFEDALMYSQKASDILNIIYPKFEETLLSPTNKEKLNLEAKAKTSIESINSLIEKFSSSSLPQ